jgi:hypothetical protein
MSGLLSELNSIIRLDRVDPVGHGRQARDGGLKGIETVVQRQQPMTSEGDDHRLFCLGQNRGARLFGAGLRSSSVVRLRHFTIVFGLISNFRLCSENEAPLSGHCSAMPCRAKDHCIAVLTACATLGECAHSPAGQWDRSASVTNLSQNASFHSFERIAPANRGIKQLGATSVANGSSSSPTSSPHKHRSSAQSIRLSRNRDTRIGAHLLPYCFRERRARLASTARHRASL